VLVSSGERRQGVSRPNVPRLHRDPGKESEARKGERVEGKRRREKGDGADEYQMYATEI
jgi:hypothetical protein